MINANIMQLSVFPTVLLNVNFLESPIFSIKEVKLTLPGNRQ